MTSSKRQRVLTEAYAVFCKRVSVALYEHDPDGMGSTVAAPEDEYDGEAARLASSFRAANGEKSARDLVATMYSNASDALVSEIALAWDEFKATTQ